MNRYGEVRAKKSLGQHFLTDEKMAAAIVQALSLPEGCKDVLEIGPGMGVLTRYLLQRNDLSLKVNEIDSESVIYLLQHYPTLNDKLIQGDFLQLEFDRYFENQFAVIGNFPYNISTQILFRILEHKNKIPAMVGMFQAEVAERIASPPGNRDYGILSVLLQPWYEMELLFDVPPSSFQPPPKVNSAVIRMTRNSRLQLKVEEKWFKTVVKQAFSMRRKTLRNALKPLLMKRDLEIPYLDLRAEALGWEQFEELALLLKA